MKLDRPVRKHTEGGHHDMAGVFFNHRVREFLERHGARFNSILVSGKEGQVLNVECHLSTEDWAAFNIQDLTPCAWLSKVVDR